MQNPTLNSSLECGIEGVNCLDRKVFKRAVRSSLWCSPIIVDYKSH